jgi:Fe-S-cluster containining protein
MEDIRAEDEEGQPAGDFTSWLTGVQAALAGEGESDVPCGTCTACCTSSQFVHIAPDETDSLAHIPRELRFPAPGLPKGHVLMGYDERGHCPMLKDGRCSIYEHRPRTCRTYDCRVFPASALDPGDEKPLIARQARRWTFSHDDEGRGRHAAVRTAAEFLGHNRDRLPDGLAPSNPTQQAVLAVEIHETFLRSEEGTDRAADASTSYEVIEQEIMVRVRRRKA